MLSFTCVTKKYTELDTALQQVSFGVESGEFTALAGPSGSGKTTILNLAAGLDTVSNGTVSLLGKNLSQLNRKTLFQLRRQNIGFIFQCYNLFPVLTAMENVEFPLALNGIRSRERKIKAWAALEEVELGGLGSRLPCDLSGGQQQRVAIARAIVTQPRIIFADEPTANVDSETAKKLLALFRSLNSRKKITFLFSSHDPLVLQCAKRVIRVADGRLVADES